MATASEESQEFAHSGSDGVTLRKETTLEDDVRDDERTAGQVFNGQDEVARGQTCTIMGRPVPGPMAIGNISAPVNFGGPQEITINTTNNNIGQQKSTYIRKQVTKQYFISQNCSSCHDSGIVSENEDNETGTSLSADIRDEVNPEEVSRAVALLDQNRRVALCGPPGSGRSSLGHAILIHYRQRGFKAYPISKLTCQYQQSFSKKKQTIILLDGGFGVVRLDSKQYDRCQDLINNTQCLLVLTVYPHLLRDMAVLDNRRPLLPSSLVINMKSRRHDSTNVFTPSVVDYLPLFQHMLHDPNCGSPMAALLALSMVGSDSFELDLPRLGFHSVDHYFLKQLAYNFRGSILPETGPGFASRVLYDAAGLALGSLHSTSVLLQVCDVPFLVQHVRTSGGSHNSVVLVGEDLSVLMQRMYELIVDGQIADVCQHPALTCPEFFQDFDDFLTNHRDYLHRVVSAVDREHGLPLLYWSVWSPLPHLTRWCLTATLQQVREGKVLPSHLVHVVVAVLFTTTDMDARLKAKQLIKKAVRKNDKPHATELKVLELPFPRILFSQERKAKISDVKTRLQTMSICYLDKPSLPIPAKLLSVTVTEDAVSVELSSHHWYLALRLLADREVDETDRDRKTLLHIAADQGNLEAITLAVKSGASLTKKTNEGLTPYQLAQRRRKELNKATDKVNVVFNFFNAILGGNDVTVKTLLCHGSSVRDKDGIGRTGLFVACQAGQGNIANLLIDLGADVNVMVSLLLEGPQIPLFFACRKGLTHTAELLLKHQVNISMIHRREAIALHCACQCESHTASADITRLLLDAGADVNARDKCGYTPLHQASRSGRTETATLLIHRGADLNGKDKDGRTPLHHAYTTERPDIITQLIKAGADTGRVHQAVVRGDVDALMTLLQQGADVNQHDTSMGCSPLHAACLMGRTDIVTWLTQHGAIVNAADDMKRTPLHCCAAGHTQVARQLIDDGADTNVRDEGQSTPHHRAAAIGNAKIALCLIEHGAEVDAADKYDNTPLHTACENGYTETAQCLLQHGASVNVLSEFGTPLYAACENGHTQTAQCLLQRGANVNAVSLLCSTPLHTACENGHTQTAQCLLQYGANVNAVSNLFFTPLHTACENGHTETAQYLLQHGANISAVSGLNETPLHKACENGYTQTAHCLLQHGANVNAESWLGTPLHRACENGHCQTAQCLLRNGANVNAESEWRGTPLHAASTNSHTETAQCLMQYGANVNAVSALNETPLHTACRNGHTETAKRILQHGANVNAVSWWDGTPLDVTRRFARHCNDLVTLLVQHGAVSRDTGTT